MPDERLPEPPRQGDGGEAWHVLVPSERVRALERELSRLDAQADERRAEELAGLESELEETRGALSGPRAGRGRAPRGAPGRRAQRRRGTRRAPRRPSGRSRPRAPRRRRPGRSSRPSTGSCAGPPARPRAQARDSWRASRPRPATSPPWPPRSALGSPRRWWRTWPRGSSCSTAPRTAAAPRSSARAAHGRPAGQAPAPGATRLLDPRPARAAGGQAGRSPAGRRLGRGLAEVGVRLLPRRGRYTRRPAARRVHGRAVAGSARRR